MNYKKISPLGKRAGLGTFDTFFNMEKYENIEQAKEANDCVVVDFVTDDNNTIYFEFYNIKNHEEKKYHRLNYQHFPAGIDVMDDGIACQIADTMY